MQLQPSASGPTSYDLSFSDNSDKYLYTGERTTGDGQYVLIFDPVKKHFILHRIDSTFDMNLISTPWSQDSDALRSQYPQLKAQGKPHSTGIQRRSPKLSKKAAVVKADTKRQKQEKPKKPKPPVREPTPEEEEFDDSLTIEYPDVSSTHQYQYQSTPVFQQNVSEHSDVDEDAEGEEYESEHNQDIDHLKLPSPANNNAGGLSDEDIELDLEMELEQALKENEGGGAYESSESEEE